jgi:hypothetical protein
MNNLNQHSNTKKHFEKFDNGKVYKSKRFGSASSLFILSDCMSWPLQTVNDTLFHDRV